MDEVKETQAVVLKPKKTIIRTFEELHNASPKTMTEVELQKYVVQLRANLEQAEYGITNYIQNCNSAYGKVRELEQKYADIQTELSRKLHFVKQQIAACYSAITLLKVEE